MRAYQNYFFYFSTKTHVFGTLSTQKHMLTIMGTKIFTILQFFSKQKIITIFFSTKMYVFGTQKNRLNETGFVLAPKTCAKHYG